MKIRILATPTSYIKHRQSQISHPNDKACPEYTDWEVKLLDFAKFEEEIDMQSVEETITFLEACQVEEKNNNNSYINYGLDNAESFDLDDDDDDFGTPLPPKGTAYTYQLIDFTLPELQKISQSIQLTKSDIKGVYSLA